MRFLLRAAFTTSIALLLPNIVGAATVLDTADLTGSTVDVTVKELGNPIGSETGISVTSGTVDISAIESGGVFSNITLTGGSFIVADTSIVLGGSLTGNSLNSTGLGFSIDNSAFSLTPTGASTYDITGVLNLLADTGSAAIVPFAYMRDFASTPQPFSASLINSSVTITPSGGGEYNYTGSLRFSDTVLDTTGPWSISVSSLNTINLSGTFVPIPEPSTSLLAFTGLLMMIRRRR